MKIASHMHNSKRANRSFLQRKQQPLNTPRHEDLALCMHHVYDSHLAAYCRRSYFRVDGIALPPSARPVFVLSAPKHEGHVKLNVFIPVSFNDLAKQEHVWMELIMVKGQRLHRVKMRWKIKKTEGLINDSEKEQWRTDMCPLSRKVKGQTVYGGKLSRKQAGTDRIHRSLPFTDTDRDTLLPRRF